MKKSSGIKYIPLTFRQHLLDTISIVEYQVGVASGRWYLQNGFQSTARVYRITSRLVDECKILQKNPNITPQLGIRINFFKVCHNLIWRRLPISILYYKNVMHDGGNLTSFADLASTKT